MDNLLYYHESSLHITPAMHHFNRFKLFAFIGKGDAHKIFHKLNIEVK